MPFKFNPFTGNLDLVEVSSSPTGDVAFLTGNSGGAIPPDGSGNINVLGSNTQGINIVGSGHTLTVSGIDATTTQKGVVALATNAEAIAGSDTAKAITSDDLKAKLGNQTQFGVILGAGQTSALGVSNAATNGQVLLGATAGNPAFGTITSPDNSITFVAGANSLQMTVNGGSTVGKTITGNSGGALAPVSGNWNIVGTGSITTSGSGNTLTAQLTGLTNHAVLVGAGSATITKLSVGTNGQVLLGATGADPAFATLTSTGGTITYTTGVNALNLDVALGGFTWTDVTGATQTLAVQNGYITDRGGGVTYTLPSTATQGATIIIMGKLGLATVAQNANQQILIGSSSSTVGAGGSITATNVGDCITLVAITGGASTVWRAQSLVGNWTIV